MKRPEDLVRLAGEHRVPFEFDRQWGTPVSADGGAATERPGAVRRQHLRGRVKHFAQPSSGLPLEASERLGMVRPEEVGAAGGGHEDGATGERTSNLLVL